MASDGFLERLLRLRDKRQEEFNKEVDELICNHLAGEGFALERRVVVCKTCGQKNRLRKPSARQQKCGACGAVFGRSR